jgi:cytoskeleton protein RodZ
MQELGEVLHSARLSKGLTLENVNERTKISFYVLEALEQGAKESLPHPVYTKGFLKDYARLLGLDAEKIIQDYLAIIGPVETLELDTGVPALKVRKVSKSRTGRFWVGLGVVVLLAGGIWLAVSFVSQNIVLTPPVIVYEQPDNATAANETSDMQSESAETLTVEESNASLPLVSDEQTLPENPDVPDTAVLDSNSPRANPIQSKPSELPSVASASVAVSDDAVPEATTVPAMEKNPGDHVLVITARSDCWIRSLADEGENGKISVRLLHPGMSMTVFFAKTVQLKLGNAGGVDILLDDRPYAFPATSGEVKTLDFDAADF